MYHYLHSREYHSVSLSFLEQTSWCLESACKLCSLSLLCASVSVLGKSNRSGVLAYITLITVREFVQYQFYIIRTGAHKNGQLE